MTVFLEMLRLGLKNRSIASIRRIARRIARIMTPLLGKRMHVAETNARIVGADDPEETAKRSVSEILASFMELFGTGQVDEDFVKNHVTVEGEEHLRTVVNDDKGFFITSAHLGSWELIVPILLVMTDIDFVGLSRSMRSRKAFDFVTKLRTGTSGRIRVLGNRNVTGDITRAVNDGSGMFALLDHTATLKDCVMVELFGHKATFMAGVPAISARKNVPLLMTYAVRTDTGVRLIFEEPITPNMDLKPKERIKDIARRVNESYEGIISRHPEQWFLIHKRFNKVEMPDGSISTHVYDSAPAG